MENRDLSIVIPYGGSCIWFDNELRHVLRSISKNFNFNYDITIYSDKKLDFLKDVNVVKIDRYYPDNALRAFNGIKHYENFYDTLNKLKIASESEELSENILWMYDDLLLLKELDLDAINVLYAGGKFDDNREYWMNPGKNKWKNTIFQAIKRARGYGEVYLYETHLPRLYKKSKLREMFKMFPIDQMTIPYAPATLYFNLFHNKPDEIYVKQGDVDNKVKAGFYGPSGNLCDSFPSQTLEQIEEHTANKIWVNYSDAGLTNELRDWITKKFPKKCKYEV